jgi:F-type H+-transporting ATPase subunit a
MTSKINTYKRFTSIFLLIFSLFIGFTNKLTASKPLEHEVGVAHVDSAYAGTSAHAKLHDPNAPVDITAIALEHVADSHSWHLWGEGEGSVALPLPVIIYSSSKGLQLFSSAKFEHGHASYNGYKLEEEKVISEDANESFYDISITKNVAQMLFSAILIFVLFTSIAKSYKSHGVTSAPRGKQSFFEPLITFVRDDIAKGNIGHGSEKFVPYLLTIFFMILINNVFGMIPIGANLTGNIAFTLVLSIATLIVTNINGNKNYWSHIFLPHAPKAIWPILIPIEIVGILTKPFALMIRLFANMTAGHIIIISLIGLIFVFKSIYIAPVSIAFALFIDVLECLVAFLQAYVFTMLTALFIGSAVADHNEDGAHTTDDDHVTSGH